MNENLNQAILGVWRTDPDDLESLQTFGEIVLYFYAEGQLIYEVAGRGRVLLTWRIEGNVLITDQPSDPREERERFELRLDQAPGQLLWYSPHQLHPERFIRAHIVPLVMLGTFDALLEQVELLLAPQGYVRVAHSFLKQQGHNWGVIAFSEVTSNHPDLVKFMMDIGVYSHCIAEFMFQSLSLRPPEQPEYVDCHWRQSVLDNLNNPTKPAWWNLLKTVLLNAIGSEPAQRQFLTQVFLQAATEIDQHLTDEALKAYWLSGGGPEISNSMCLRFASILLKASGETEQLEQVLDYLERHYRLIAAPHLCQIRGETPDTTLDLSHALLGLWGTHSEDEDDIQRFGKETLYFTSDGQVIYEIGDRGKHSLSWRVEGHVLITDQPVYPRKGRIECYIVSEHSMMTISPEGYITEYIRDHPVKIA